VCISISLSLTMKSVFELNLVSPGFKNTVISSPGSIPVNKVGVTLALSTVIVIPIPVPVYVTERLVSPLQIYLVFPESHSILVKINPVSMPTSSTE